MTQLEGNPITVSGDEYDMVTNLGSLWILKRNDLITFYFQSLGILIPTKKKTFSRDIKEENNSLVLNEEVFPVTGYGGTECGIRTIFTNVKGVQLGFFIDNKKETIMKVE
jgi:hypothetical protein